MTSSISPRKLPWHDGAAGEHPSTAATAPKYLVRGEVGHWSERPLCRRYALVLVSSVSAKVPGPDSVDGQLWRWALGMLADGECEALGAWPATASHDLLLREHLRERGVERMGALMGDEALARVMEVPVARPPLKGSGLAAMVRAAQLHAKIERAVSRESPFADFDSASACIARVLEKDELAELAQQRRSLRDQWRARRSQTPAPAAGA